VEVLNNNEDTSMNQRLQNADDDVRRNPFDLKQLIAAENDPKQRVLLMLVNNFNDNLAANTIAVEDNAKAVNNIARDLESLFTKFEERAAKDDEMRNQGKGAWRVLAWVFGVVQVGAAYAWVDTRAELKELRMGIVASQKADATLEAKIYALEAATRTNRE